MVTKRGFVVAAFATATAMQGSALAQERPSKAEG